MNFYKPQNRKIIELKNAGGLMKEILELKPNGAVKFLYVNKDGRVVGKVIQCVREIMIK